MLLAMPSCWLRCWVPVPMLCCPFRWSRGGKGRATLAVGQTGLLRVRAFALIPFGDCCAALRIPVACALRALGAFSHGKRQTPDLSAAQKIKGHAQQGQLSRSARNVPTRAQPRSPRLNTPWPLGLSRRTHGLRPCVGTGSGIPPAPCWSLLSCGLSPPVPPGEGRPSPRCRRSGSPLHPADQ